MRDERGRPAAGDTGSVLVLALLLVTLLSLLGVTLLAVATNEHSIAYNAFWSEGALAAADAGVNTGISQLSANQTTTDAAVSDNIGGVYAYRSGHRADAAPQQFQFVGTRHEGGYSLVSGSNQYNTSGYDFDNHQFNATGTGPRNALREVEVQAEYGPILR